MNLAIHRKANASLSALVVLSLLGFTLSRAAAQSPPPPASDSGIDLPNVVTGVLGRMLGPNLEMPPTAEPIPPPPEHTIPLKAEGEPNSVLVENDEGFVRLVVRDAPLRHVLALLAESHKLNLVFSTTSDAQVTVALDRVPLSTALDAILSTCGHTWARRGEVIHITEINAATLLTPEVQGRRLQVLELDYLAAADVDLAVKGLLSPIGKSWVFESTNDDNLRTREVVVVEDLSEYVERIAIYVAQIDQPPRQVLVEVQILQVDLDDDLKHGVNFEELARIGGTSIRFETTGFADPTSPQAFFIEATGGDLSSLVELLQTTNDAKTLASPKLLAVNGQESKIQIGERLPYRETTTTQTSSQESVKFIDVGVVLTFTPWITRDGRVLMRVAPKVSEGAVNSNTGLPEESTTEVETDAFLADGQGIIIGGLISERDVVNQSKIPVLGDFPYFGVLFERRQAKRTRSEILIALMPHLLPYNPTLQCANDQEVGRARDPLVHGPLMRYPRPYEARLPDPVNLGCKHCYQRRGLPHEFYPGYGVSPVPCEAPAEPVGAPSYLVPPYLAPPGTGQPTVNSQAMPVASDPTENQAASTFAPPAIRVAQPHHGGQQYR
ncbi:MAG: type II secretion system protein GspD [Aeoliella sp.]